MTNNNKSHRTRAIELLNVQKGHSCLEIGIGSTGQGVQTLAKIVASSSTVYGIDRDHGKVDSSTIQLQQSQQVDVLRLISLVAGDGFEMLPGSSLFDRILISCLLPKIMDPETIRIPLLHLKIDGKMIAPTLLPTINQPWFVLYEKKKNGGLLCNLLERFDDSMKVPSTYQKGLATTSTTKSARKEELKQQLTQWRKEFELKHKHPPTRAELFNDPIAGPLFKEFSSIQ
jgi:protein-L-isoaspartate O-methyltransferase